MDSGASSLQRALLLVLAVAALIVGIYARFKGLGAAPLSVDEYYLARSIENVIRTGLPAYSCGGYYTRGVLLQYLSAGLQIWGVAPELAPRLLAATCSLLILPPSYLLARRLQGPEAGTLVVVVLALSVWEIEMARFGRMYAPFQPVCVWYLFYFVRFTVDRDAKAMYPMLLLTILAPLVWEGGALLALLNMLPLFMSQQKGKLPREGWGFFGVAVGIFIAAYWFVTADFRGFNAASWPPGFSRALATPATTPLSAYATAFAGLNRDPMWLVLAAMPAIVATFALRWILRLWRRPLAALGLLAVLLAALCHQLGAAAAVVLLLLLLRVVNCRELAGKPARPLHAAILAGGLFWLIFALYHLHSQYSPPATLARSIAAFAYQFLSFPDFAGVVAQPWARAVPMLGLGLFVIIGGALIREALSTEPMTVMRSLLIAFLVLLLAASASHPPRQETRYVYFLYPLAIIIAITAIARVCHFLIRNRRSAVTAATLVSLSGFALSEDFQPHHLQHIDAPAELFRANMSLDMQGHLEIRNDYRRMALWLSQHVMTDRDQVVNGVHGLDYYYPNISYFFADERDPDFPSWSCSHGTVERWGNYRLLYSTDALRTAIQSRRDTYLVFYPDNYPRLLGSLREFDPRLVWSQGYVAIALLRTPQQAH